MFDVLISLPVLLLAASPMIVAYDDDGMITVNGKRTLIIGSYMVGNKYTAPKPTLELYEELADAGFNVVHASGANMDLAHQAGLYTWVSVGAIDLEDRDASSARVRGAVEAVRDHPSLLYIETIDEPAWTWMEAGARVPPEVFAETYPIIKRAAPNHLLYMNHAPTNLVSTMHEYNSGTDVVAMDIYPVNPGGLAHLYALFEDGHQGDLNNTYISQVGDYVDKMRRVTGPHRPLLMVLQGFAWEMLVDETKFERREEKILYPTYNQTRFMAYQALIKGANGIVYWGTYYTPQPSDCWTGIKRVTRELADLAGPLTERDADIEPLLEYIEVGHSVDDGVQMRAKAHGDKLYLFTCNADKHLNKATISNVGDWTTCRVLDEDRTVPVEDGAFTDTWKRFDVHVYELSR